MIARDPYPVLTALLLGACLLVAGCGKGPSNRQETATSAADSLENCCGDAPSRPGTAADTQPWTGPVQDQGTGGMVLVPGGSFTMGASDARAYPDEYPPHPVTVSAFWLDRHEVTNEQFAAFVAATGYVTTAERPIDWEEMAKNAPPGTPRPPEDMLQPGALVFRQTRGAVPLQDHTQWWAWTPGASWRHPEGPGSDLRGRENHPVVQVSWDDAQAYAAWAGKRLPTEAEWEWAARGGLEAAVYPWGSEGLTHGKPKANYWEGDFPYRNSEDDGYTLLAPVGQYAPNGYGLYDMAGNVWEWCQDWYHPEYYRQVSAGVVNPRGPARGYDPAEPLLPKRILRGGSFLCNDAYCAGYRVAARMKSSPDSGLQHSGFRCARSTAPEASEPAGAKPAGAKPAER